MLAAVFGVGGHSESFSDFSETPSGGGQKSFFAENGSGNRYAAELSGSILSFDNLTEDDFTNIIHNPPFSFGMKARKNFATGGAAFEIGLTYTYLVSRFEMWNYNVQHDLHYIGLPVNLVGYLGNSKHKNWRVYVSGGFMVEKGLRAIYRQEITWGSQRHNTTVRSSINGMQWSLNGSVGITRRLENGFGIYFEPRAGYSFDGNQPISIRTEMPVYFGVNFGLNYEL